MVVEAQRVAAFVFDALVADATFSAAVGGRIYRDQVPQAATLPAAIVGPIVSSVSLSTVGGLRVWDDVSVDVHLVAAGGSYAPINAAADRADAVLQNRSGTSGGVVIVELVRTAPQLFVENEGGAVFAHIVQTYQTEAHVAP